MPPKKPKKRLLPTWQRNRAADVAEPLRLGIPSLVYRRVDPGFPHDADTQTRSVLSENGETPRGPLRLFTPRARLPGPTPST